MPSARDKILFNRALHMICREFGKTLDETMEWLNRDEDWAEEDKGPPNNEPSPPSPAGTFVQVQRTSIIKNDTLYDKILAKTVAGIRAHYKVRYGVDMDAPEHTTRP